MLTISILLFLTGCSDSSRTLSQADPMILQADGSDDDNNANQPVIVPQQVLLAEAGANFILPSYSNLASVAKTFVDEDGALASYCSAGFQSTGEDQLLRSEWLKLVKAVQQTEMHAVGPVTKNGSALRNRITSYHAGPPSFCGIDEVAILHDDPGFDLGGRASNQKGLSALDYLLFNKDLKHSCPPQATLTQSWNQLSEEERFDSRCSAAKVLAEDLAAASDSVLRAWDAEGGNYIETFSAESTVGENFQSFTDALFFLEEGAKDAKLGNPLGIIDACSSVTCPDLIELPHSRTSMAAILENIKAFDMLFQMNDETGFDLLIQEEGFGDVTQRFITNISSAIDFAGSVETTLVDQVDSLEQNALTSDCSNAMANPDTPSDILPSCTLYGLVKRVVDDMKIDFITILNVNLPGGTRADND